jgi:hypothetical protein
MMGHEGGETLRRASGGRCGYARDTGDEKQRHEMVLKASKEERARGQNNRRPAGARTQRKEGERDKSTREQANK